MIIRNKIDLINASLLVSKSYLLTYDVETTGLNPRKDSLIGIGFCNVETMESCYIILKEYVNGKLHTVLDYASILPILKLLSTRKLIMHNASFDCRFTVCQTGVDLIPALYCDTMLLAHTLNENRFNYGLKEMASEILGPHVTAEQEDMKVSIKENGGSVNELYKANSILIAKYGEQDVRLTAQVFTYLNNCSNPDLRKFFYDEEVMPLYREVTIPMELHGIHVDLDLLKNTSKEIKVKLNEYEDKIQTAIKPYLTPFEQWYINTKYPYKLTGPFRQKLALDMAPANWPRTDTGAYSFNAAEIKKAIKKKLIEPNTLLQQYAVDMSLPVPPDLIRKIQLELLADEGLKYAFNLLSTDHLKRLFFGTANTESLLKEKPLNTTDKGNPQCDDAFLELMADKYDWAALLQTYRSLVKLNGTYVDRILTEQERGVFYPQFFQHRTTSGRYSGDMQQLPRKKSIEEIPNEDLRYFTNLIRDFFVAAPGHKLVDADYSSLEVVVFADDAQDQALLDIINNGYDFYSQVAIQVKGLHQYSADKKAPNFLKNALPDLRQEAKAYALGLRYGLGSFKLAKQLNISQTEAQKIVNDYFKAFPRLKERMDEIVTSAKKFGMVKSKAGRVRRIPELKRWTLQYGEVLFDGLELWKEFNTQPAKYTEMKKTGKIARNLVNNALNFPIQSMAASIVSRASIAIAREFKHRNMKAYIALSQHDELCIHCTEQEAEQVKIIMQDKMENTTKLSVPLNAEPTIGNRYGDIK